ncbi:MAG: molybdenum cofactor biosynthesis protein MoaE [Deltaproteobacteria bacterium]|nr:molybdenum cofactor biosynthesis protein MoaE [Deltaproteobacteria bacterium]
MEIHRLIDRIKAHPDYHKVGMILCHNGVVRGTSRDGRKVTGLKVVVDHEKLAHVIETYKNRAGIIEILVEIAENKVLNIGDDVMVLAVAGDVRDNVISTLHDTLNEIKTTVTEKEEFFAGVRR